MSDFFNGWPEDGEPTMNNLTKVCGNCGDTLYLEKFYIDRTKLDGHRADCIECQKSRHKNPDVVAFNRLLKGWGK